MKQLHGEGLGAKKRQAEPISQEEKELLWEKELLGQHSAQALVDTMPCMSGTYLFCGLDKSIEHCGIPPLR